VDPNEVHDGLTSSAAFSYQKSATSSLKERRKRGRILTTAAMKLVFHYIDHRSSGTFGAVLRGREVIPRSRPLCDLYAVVH
jgi:hypothetical protein